MLLLLPFALAGDLFGSDLADPSAPPQDAAPSRGNAVLGVAYVPAGIGSQAWEDDNRFTGSLVGEFDGWLRPALTVHGGWAGAHDALLGSFSAAVFHDRTLAETSTVLAVGALRPGLDYRRYLRARRPGATNGYGTAGIYGVLPLARDLSDAYTAEEQADAAEGEDSLRAQLGGVGAQLGLGAEYLFPDHDGQPAFSLGFRYLGRVYRGQSLQEDAFRISTVWMSEGALVFELYL